MKDIQEMRQTLHLSSKDLPEIKKWEVGETYTIALKVKQVGLNLDTYDDKKMTTARFEIISAKPVKSDPGEYSKGAVTFAKYKVS